MVRVVRLGRFSAYVYAESGQPHYRPHCYVYWSDGESVVDLIRLAVLSGQRLPAPARDLLREHLSDNKRVWTALHPGRPTT